MRSLSVLGLALLTACPSAPPPADEPTPAPPPQQPDDLESWLTGSGDDASPTLEGPSLLLIGGGLEPDDPFASWLEAAAGGDVVVIRASGSDGYNDWVYSDLGGVDLVETLLLDRRELADDPWVAWRLEQAEAIWIAGGDQAVYAAEWTGTGVEDALRAAWGRGAAVGGTSAGLAVLGEFAFTARNGSVTSDEALSDPYASRVTLERDLWPQPPLAGVITDSHFAERERLGRLVAWAARIEEDWETAPLGVGIDERTTLLVDSDGVGTVAGPGSVWLVRGEGAPSTCAPGEPLEHTVRVWQLDEGDTVALPDGGTAAPSTLMTASGGSLFGI